MEPHHLRSLSRIFKRNCSFSSRISRQPLKKLDCNPTNTSQNFINGGRKAANGATVALIDPGTGVPVGSFFESSKDDVEKAIESSRYAFENEWSQWSATERNGVLRRAGRLLLENVNELAKLESIDTGKTLTEATFDVEGVYECCNYFSSLCHTLNGQYIPLSGDSWAYTRREPLGVCTGIGAWNFPISNIAWKALPALACGNTLVYKPSPLTPLSSTLFAEILSEVGLPNGVLNVVQGGAEVGEIFCSHPEVDKVSFTGSVETGSKVMAACAPGIKNVTLELGGKSPMVVFEDADIPNAVQGALMANYITQGEVCSNAARIYVHESIFEEYVDLVVAATKNLRLGDPKNGRSQLGALISSEHRDKVEGFIQRAKDEGARIRCGGERPDFSGTPISEGYYLTPCVMDNCHDDMEIIKEEHFGPVMCILPFSTEDEVLERSNNTRFGLAGGVFTRDISRAHRFIAKLRAGSCCINTYNMYPVQIPFGGNKMSGIGRENSTAVLDHYTQMKSVYVEMGDVDSMFTT